MGLSVIARDTFVSGLITEVRAKGAKVVRLRNGKKCMSENEFRSLMHKANLWTKVQEDGSIIVSKSKEQAAEPAAN